MEYVQVMFPRRLILLRGSNLSCLVDPPDPLRFIFVEFTWKLRCLNIDAEAANSSERAYAKSGLIFGRYHSQISSHINSSKFWNTSSSLKIPFSLLSTPVISERLPHPTLYIKLFNKKSFHTFQLINYYFINCKISQRKLFKGFTMYFNQSKLWHVNVKKINIFKPSLKIVDNLFHL